MWMAEDCFFTWSRREARRVCWTGRMSGAWRSFIQCRISCWRGVSSISLSGRSGSGGEGDRGGLAMREKNESSESSFIAKSRLTIGVSISDHPLDT